MRLASIKVAPARVSAYNALLAIERGAWSAEALRGESLHLDSRDAGLASEICFGTLRHKGELDRVIETFAQKRVRELDLEVVTALEMALYQIRYLERVPAHAAVNDSVELMKKSGTRSAAPFVNAILRRSLREKLAVPVEASTPKWLMEGWVRQYGAELALKIAAASLEVPEAYIRLPEAQLQSGTRPPQGAEPTEIPGCYKLDRHEIGDFRYQDISSQAVVPLLDLKPEHLFLDLCGAPGNKTAQALEAKPRLAFTCDLHLSRARMLQTLRIPVTVLDGTQPLPFAIKFDRILVDAPCSGTGTLGRNPDIKWRLKYDDISDLQDRQTSILKNALQVLAPGGKLVYSTCSLERDENEDVVAATEGYVTQTMHRIPGRDAGDGFFAAVLTR